MADDEALVRRTAKSALERQGYRVLLAENGREAMDLLRELRRVLAEKIKTVLEGA